MSQTLPLPPLGFDSLSVEEQIGYVQSLWDHIAARPEQVPVPDWHREVLTEPGDRTSGKNLRTVSTVYTFVSLCGDLETVETVPRKRGPPSPG
jgi:hypothetical protein